MTVKAIINGLPVEVAVGTSILDAAKKIIAAARAEGAVSDRGEFTALATAHHGSSSR